MSSKIQIPFPSFYDIDGRPLDAGYVYLGEVGKNPEVYPVSAFWDEALTVPAAQPVRTRNGYFSKNGKPGKLFVSQMSCSITIKNKNGIVIYTDLHSDLGFNQKYFINSVGTIAELQNAEVWDGRIVFVKEYNANTGVGGDFFKYDATKSGVNDYGYVINGWIRQKEVEKITVVDFGAIPDGVTDAMPAVRKMDAWQLSLYDKIGIKFPAGKFALSEWDDSLNRRWNFKIQGVGSKFGYMNETTIFMINPANTHVFKVQSRWTEIVNLKIEGGSNPETTARHFVKNTIDAGQYIRVNNLVFMNLGGVGLDFLDTLDCKIDQFYTYDGYDNQVKVTFSGATTGTWDHSTAIELSNVNSQRHKGATADKCAFFMPRVTQALMSNVWIEDAIHPMNISEGEWIIDSINCERCTNPVLAQYAKLTIKHKNNLTIFDYNNGEIGNYNGITRPDWVTSRYETGVNQIHPTYMQAGESLSYGYQTSASRRGQVSYDKWVKVGRYEMPVDGQLVEVEVLGIRNGDSGNTATTSSTTTRLALGKAVIGIQYKGDNNSGECSWFGQGVSPIFDVRIKKDTTASNPDSTFILYIKVAAYATVSIFNKTNSTNRLQSGIHFTFKSIMQEVEESEATASDTQIVRSSFVVNNTNYGFGMDMTDGRLIVNAPVSANKIPIYVNGVLKYISYTDS